MPELINSSVHCFVALLLYLIPAVLDWAALLRAAVVPRGAILTLGTAIAIAVVASVIWFTR